MAKSKESTPSPSPYDNVFRTVVHDCSNFVLYLLNASLGTHYTGRETVIPLSDAFCYQSLQESLPDELENWEGDGGDTAPYDKITDSGIAVINTSALSPQQLLIFKDAVSPSDTGPGSESGSVAEAGAWNWATLQQALGGHLKLYNLTCASSPYDKTIFEQIFQSCMSIAVQSIVSSGDGTDVYLPKPVLLCLRSPSEKRHTHTIQLLFEDEVLEYPVQIIHNSDYSMEDLFDKKLYFLIPFAILNSESKLEICETDEAQRNELFHVYANMRHRLDRIESEGLITTFEKKTLCETSLVVIRKITENYANVQKGLEHILSGSV